MGLPGLKESTFKALLNANYMMACLSRHYPIPFSKPYCAHEFIVDLRPFVQTANVTALDFAKRLQVLLMSNVSIYLFRIMGFIALQCRGQLQIL